LQRTRDDDPSAQEACGHAAAIAGSLLVLNASAPDSPYVWDHERTQSLVSWMKRVCTKPRSLWSNSLP